MVQPTQSLWVPCHNRTAWHEVGHVATAYYLSSVPMGCNLTQTIPPNTPKIPKTHQEKLNAIAFFQGGRAAVEYAILHQLILPAPPGIEAIHGEHGYSTGGGGQTDYSQAWLYTQKISSINDERKQAYQQAYVIAQNCIEMHAKKIEALVSFLVKNGVASQQDVVGHL